MKKKKVFPEIIIWGDSGKEKLWHFKRKKPLKKKRQIERSNQSWSDKSVDTFLPLFPCFLWKVWKMKQSFSTQLVYCHCSWGWRRREKPIAYSPLFAVLNSDWKKITGHAVQFTATLSKSHWLTDRVHAWCNQRRQMGTVEVSRLRQNACGWTGDFCCSEEKMSAQTAVQVTTGNKVGGPEVVGE